MCFYFYCKTYCFIRQVTVTITNSTGIHTKVTNILKSVPLQEFKQGILHVLCEYVERYLELVRKSAGLQ